MEENYIAFIKGSKKYDTLRLGVIIYHVESERIVYRHKEKIKNWTDTSAREEYRAIMLAVKNVPMGSHITIYTNNLTAVNVFSGVWKAKKHTDIVNEFFVNCYSKDVKVLDAGEHPTDEVKKGMAETENFCRAD